MALPGRLKSIALITGSPTFSAPDMYVYRAPPIEFFDGQVELDSDWQLSDPEVWPLNTLKLDPADGIPIKEALFSNHNANMALSVDGQSLVGRTEPTRGLAHKIKVDFPLTFVDRTIGLDPTFQPAGDSGNGIPEAPRDHVPYGRRDAAWTPVLMVSNDIVDGGNF